jgi:acyl-CoA synthetase (AMP-forming)/AMP-acid ligase II
MAGPGVTTTLGDLLFEPEGELDSSEVLVVDADVSTTRAELITAADGVCSRLRDLATPTGAAVAVQLPDGWPVIATLFGVWKAGAVYVPVNPRLTRSEVGRLFDTVRPALHITPGDGGDLRFERTSVPPTEYDDDIALVQMTSGTTGTPKAVLLTHAGVLELMDGVLRKIRGGGRANGVERRAKPMPNLVPVSLSLWAGIYNVLFAFRVGASVVLLSPFDTTRFAGVVREQGIKSTVLPPAAMTMLADDPEIGDLAPLRFVRSITAPLSPLQARRFHDKFGVQVLNSYGQTEIGGEIVGWNAADAREFGETKLGAIGRPHDGVEVRVDSATSELQVRTPATSAGYADGNDLADRLTADGWFRTGDVGRVDDDGFVWVEGRMSDMINRGGLKVFPSEVEEVIRLAAEVADVAVVGIPDDRLGEVPVAFVVLRATAAITDEDLNELCRTHLAPYKVPVRYERLPALPRNEVGKVLTRSLVDGTGSDSSPKDPV